MVPLLTLDKMSIIFSVSNEVKSGFGYVINIYTLHICIIVYVFAFAYIEVMSALCFASYAVRCMSVYMNDK